MKQSIIFLYLFLLSTGLYAEDGSRLWLRSETGRNTTVTANKQSPTIDIAKQELESQWKGAPVQLKITNNKGLAWYARPLLLKIFYKKFGCTLFYAYVCKIIYNY